MTAKVTKSGSHRSVEDAFQSRKSLNNKAGVAQLVESLICNKAGCIAALVFIPHSPTTTYPCYFSRSKRNQPITKISAISRGNEPTSDFNRNMFLYALKQDLWGAA